MIKILNNDGKMIEVTEAQACEIMAQQLKESSDLFDAIWAKHSDANGKKMDAEKKLKSLHRILVDIQADLKPFIFGLSALNGTYNLLSYHIADLENEYGFTRESTRTDGSGSPVV